MAKKEHVDCKCIFCNSKCPECGSTDIKVNFKPGFTCENDTEDVIFLSRVEDEIELQCNECEGLISDYRLDKLLGLLCKAIAAPVALIITVNEDGEMTSQIYGATPGPLNK